LTGYPCDTYFVSTLAPLLISCYTATACILTVFSIWSNWSGWNFSWTWGVFEEDRCYWTDTVCVL